MGETFIQQLRLVVLLALGVSGSLLLIAAGVGWIRTFFTETLARIRDKAKILEEKATDLIVAGRQKGRSLQWSQESSAALATLRTLVLNGGWERYWQQRQVLPLVAS